MIKEAKGKRVSTWNIDENGLAGSSPVAINQPTKSITLVPMGAGRFRISEFPVVN